MQNRYKSILCKEDAYLLKLVAYIHLNPLRARVVKDDEGLDGYEWSGHRALMGKVRYEWQAVDELLRLFGDKAGESRRAYRDFIYSNSERGVSEDLSGGGLRRSAGVWAGAHKLKHMKEYWRGDERILGDSNFVNEVLKEADERIEERERLRMMGWDINKVSEYVSRLLKIDKDDIMRRGKNNVISNGRKLVCHFANKDLGISGVTIGKHLGISNPAVSKSARLGARIAEQNDYKLIS